MKSDIAEKELKKSFLKYTNQPPFIECCIFTNKET